jgi:hypothetical protein
MWFASRRGWRCRRPRFRRWRRRKKGDDPLRRWRRGERSSGFWWRRRKKGDDLLRPWLRRRWRFRRWRRRKEGDDLLRRWRREEWAPGRWWGRWTYGNAPRRRWRRRWIGRPGRAFGRRCPRWNVGGHNYPSGSLERARTPLLPKNRFRDGDLPPRMLSLPAPSTPPSLICPNPPAGYSSNSQRVGLSRWGCGMLSSAGSG